MALQGYWAESVQLNVIRDFILKWHYSAYANVQAKQCFALFRKGQFDIPELVGACVYTRPAGAKAAKKYYPADPDKCLELRRLCCIDDTPKNTESFFIGYTLRWLRKNTEYKFIISYADAEQGHEGTIYKASNFKHVGMTQPGSRLLVDGKEFHIRTLSMVDRPYGREIKARWESNDPNIKIIKTKPKHIYTFEL